MISLTLSFLILLLLIVAGIVIVIFLALRREDQNARALSRGLRFLDDQEGHSGAGSVPVGQQSNKRRANGRKGPEEITKANKARKAQRERKKSQKAQNEREKSTNDDVDEESENNNSFQE